MRNTEVAGYDKVKEKSKRERMSGRSRPPTKGEYHMLAVFRYHLGQFLQFSEEAAQAAGLTPRQYQALLAIKGSCRAERLTIGDLAEQLQIVHHAAVELVDRLSAQDLVERRSSLDDRRRVFVQLTRGGSRILDKLSAAHRGELRRLGPDILTLLDDLVTDGENETAPAGLGFSEH